MIGIETRSELIDSSLKDAGWGVVAESRILRKRNYQISRGRFQGGWQTGEPGDYRIEAGGYPMELAPK